MGRPAYNPKETYLGDGATTGFESDIVVTSVNHLIIIKTDENNDEVFNVRGSDTEFIDSLTLRDDGFDIEFVDAPEDGYNLYFLQADDGPIQPFSLRNLGGFTLAAMERALDWICGWGQRHQYLIDRSMKLDDVDDETEFDMTLESGMTDDAMAGKIPTVNETSSGWEMKSPEDILAGVAANSTDDDFIVEDAMALEPVPDMIVYGSLNSSAQFLVEVQGTGIGLHVPVSVNKVDGLWKVSDGNKLGDGEHGMTFSIEDEAADDAQVLVSDDGSGYGDRTFRWKKVAFDAIA